MVQKAILLLVASALSLACTDDHALPADGGVAKDAGPKGADTFASLSLSFSSYLSNYSQTSNVSSPHSVSVLQSGRFSCSEVATDDEVRAIAVLATTDETMAALATADECPYGIDASESLTLHLTDGRFLGQADVLNCRRGSPVIALRDAARVLVTRYCPPGGAATPDAGTD